MKRKFVLLFSLVASAIAFASDGAFTEWSRSVKAADFVREGVVADKGDGSITIFAKSTGLVPGDVVEYPIVNKWSDRDYEALFLSYAKPSDLAAAFDYLGVKKGRPTSPGEFIFNSIGERIFVSVAPFESKEFKPLSDFVRDKNRASFYDSFVYIGSRVDDNGHCVADDVTPGAVLAAYNEPDSLLEVPARCGKSQVYERFVLSNTNLFKTNSSYLIKFKPVGDKKSFLETKLSFSSTNSLPLLSVNGGEFSDLKAGIDAINNLRGKVFDLFAQVEFDKSLSVAESIAACKIVDALEKREVLRVNMAPGAPLYYRAFLPDEEWRKKETRVVQPWEVHFKNGEYRLIQGIEDWSKDEFNPTIITKEFVAKSPASVVETIRENEKSLSEKRRLPVLILFTDEATKLSEILPLIEATNKEHPYIHIFTE